MATIRVIDPETLNTQTISADVFSYVLQDQETGSEEFFIKLSTSARRVNGDDIPDYIIQNLSDLVRGSTQHDGVTGTNYADLTAAINDYVDEMIEGTGDGDDGTQMDFS